MVAQPQQTHYTVEEYLELDRNSTDARYEYYDGVIRMMSGGTGPHGLIGGNVIFALNTVLVDSPCGVFTSEVYVQINAARYVHPDVTVSCEPEDLAGDIIHTPVVVFEVLSPNTESHDRGRKADYYRAVPSIMEYVLIDQQQAYVQVQRRHSDSNLWAIESYGEGESFTLTSLNVTLTVADIYRKVVFPDAAGPVFPDADMPH